MPQEKLAQAVARPQMVFLRGLPRADEVPQRLVGGIGHPHRRQIARPITARQLQCVPPIGFHPIARLHRHQRRRDDLTAHAEAGQLPIHHIPGGARLVAGPQLLGRAQFLHQLAKRLRAIGNDTDGSNLPGRLRHRDRNRFRVDIQTDTSYVAHDRLLRMWLCDVMTPITQRNPRAANRSRSFHFD